MTESRFARIDKRLTERKIVTIDIERAAGLAHIFDQKTSGFIPASRWVRQPRTLCFAARWYGGKTEFHAAWDDYDAMIRRAWEIYDQADIVVTYNGIRFDNRVLKSDWAALSMTPPATWKNVDLYAVNRATFGYSSNSLAHLCQQLGLPGKSGHYDPFMADACMAGDTKAQATMRRYNIGDVKITEQCYDALRPWIANHPHVTTDRDKATCNACGSDRLERAGTYLAQVMEYAQYRCSDCGALVRAAHVRRVARTRGVRS